eukprot:scaffold6516_cov68-Skeletonema_dohrnii-CCMP3373.AAC.2
MDINNATTSTEAAYHTTKCHDGQIDNKVSICCSSDTNHPVIDCTSVPSCDAPASTSILILIYN